MKEFNDAVAKLKKQMTNFGQVDRLIAVYFSRGGRIALE
jgi:hypothetical protein